MPLALIGAAHLFVSIVSQASDPVSTFAPLGVTGVVAVILFMWRQETAKKLDKATELNDQLIPLLTRVLDVVQASNAAHEDSAKAMYAASEALKRVPTEETFTRIKVALERSESAWTREPGQRA